MEEIIFIKTGKLSLDVPVDLFSQKKNSYNIKNNLLFKNIEIIPKCSFSLKIKI